MLVFSAGLGDCVTASLQAAGFLLPHVKVLCVVLRHQSCSPGLINRSSFIRYVLYKHAISRSMSYEYVSCSGALNNCGNRCGVAYLVEGPLILGISLPGAWDLIVALCTARSVFGIKDMSLSSNTPRHLKVCFCLFPLARIVEVDRHMFSSPI